MSQSRAPAVLGALPQQASPICPRCIMAQPSNLIQDSSQPCSDESSLHYHRCWWAWCYRSFDSRKDLLDHVCSEHAQKAQPERLRDVSTHKAAEDEHWGSSEPSGLRFLPSSPREVPSQQSDDNQGKLLDAVPLILPSPPTSSPQESTNARVHRRLSADHASRSGSPLFLSQVPASSAPLNGLLTPLPKNKNFETHTFTPTFASLSSQPNSPGGDISIIPDSPSFNSLVAAATEKSSSSHTGSVHWGNTYSVSEEYSQESVFNHLTQGMDEEENEEGRPKGSVESMASCSVASADPLLSPNSQAATHSTPQSERKGELPHSNSEQSSHSQTALQIQTLRVDFNHERSSPPSSLSPTYSIGTPVTRQSWYQSPYLRRPSFRMPSLELKAKPEVNLVALTSPEPTSANHRAEAVPQEDLSVSHMDCSTIETQDNWTSTESQAPASYPPLQTQAPYWSQSMSQD